jgi:hypothetical protein
MSSLHWSRAFPAPFVAGSASPQPVPAAAPDNPITDYFAAWFDRVEAAQASQPHWTTPITTVTPRLEEEFRYDQFQQFLGNGAEVNNFSAARDWSRSLRSAMKFSSTCRSSNSARRKGMNVAPATGFADWNFLTVKQRLLSANEENGNYIVSALSGISGANRRDRPHQQGLADHTHDRGRQGWDDFDVEGTVSVPVPTANGHAIGTAIVSSVTLQYFIAPYFWPEFAFNNTYWA